MLGFATRAGKIIVGTDLVCRAMPCGKVRLVVVAAGASDSTKKKLTQKSEYYGIRAIVTEIDTEELAKVIGKASSVAAVAVTDDRFASEILKLFA
jgi:ribosomal protein L7Ae-like RNA K-turn-binding protein